MSIESLRILEPFQDGNVTPETLHAANEYFSGASPTELIDAVADLKPWNMYSFGLQAAALPSAVKEAGHNFPGVFLDTGFEHPETHDYMRTLSRYFALNVAVVEAIPLHAAKAGSENIPAIKAALEDLYRSDRAQFFGIVKHEPYKWFVDNYDVRILLGGLRRAQGHGSGTIAVRSQTERFQPGPHGTLRIYPLVDVTDEQVSRLYVPGGVPKHPLRDFYLGNRLPLTIEDQHVEKTNCTINDVPEDFGKAS